MSRDREHTKNQSTGTLFAAIYARVSTEDQDKRFSIPTQIEACQKLAAHEGYLLPNSHLSKPCELGSS